MGNRNVIFLFAIILTAISLNLVILSYTPDLWWDETVYASVGKYIFSLGNNGFFETLRPPVFPIILGFSWFLGFNPISFGKIIALFSHVFLILLVYIVVKKVYGDNVAIISSALLAFTPFVYIYSNKILTSIPTVVFAMISIYFLVKDKELSGKNVFLSGLFSGFAFMTRFPGGVIFGGLLFTLILKDLRKPRKMMNTLPFLLAGFFLVVSPYLIYNLLAYGSPVYPFVEAVIQIETTSWFHSEDPLFYFKMLPIENLFFIFSAFGLFFFFRKRDFRDFRKNIFMITLIIFLAYFQYLPAKNVRFLVPFISYVCILSAYGIHSLSETFLKKWTARIVVLIVLISGVLGVSALYLTHIRYLDHPDPGTPYHKFIGYFQENPVKGTILTSNVIIGAYTDNKLVSLFQWRFARGIYDMYKDESSVLAIDTCSMVCEKSDKECFDLKEEFIDYVSQNNVEKVHEESESCGYYVFEIK